MNEATPTVDRDDLAAYLDNYLEIDRGGDYGPNGLQVEGRSQIAKLVTGVSACAELFERAAAAGADAVLVHHGLFWHGLPLTLVGMRYRRVAKLVRSEMSLLAYHLPLDRHAEIGNNALAARAFGLTELRTIGEAEGMPLGFAGVFPEPIAATELTSRCTEIFGQPPIHFDAGPDPVRSLGIISGGAQKELYLAIEAGLDAYLTGEASEWVMNVARENRIHYFAAGHYATERLGVRALGEHVADRYGIEVEFIDVPNPV